MGGNTCSPYGGLASAELFDASTGTWTPTDSMSDARRGAFGAQLDNGNVLVVGSTPSGSGYPLLASAEIFDWRTSKWSSTGSLNAPRDSLGIVRLSGGQVLVVGGVGNPSYDVSMTSAELYDPETGTWSYTGSLNEARAPGKTLVVLANGCVLIAGGLSDRSGQVLASAELYTPPAPYLHVWVNDERIQEDVGYSRGPAEITLQTSYLSDWVFYTVDGSDPMLAGWLYEGPFALDTGAIVRAVAFDSELSDWVEAGPIEVIILPTLTAATKGGGSVAVDPPEGAYLVGQKAMVTASPDTGWRFLEWRGDASGTNPTVELDMSVDRRLEAVFGTSLRTNTLGSGTLNIEPMLSFYPYGTIARCIAKPSLGSYFVAWSSDLTNCANPANLIITDPTPLVAAVFARLPAGQSALTVVPVGGGRVLQTPLATRYTNGATVILTAIPDTGWCFAGWGGDLDGMMNPLTLTLGQSMLVRANFADVSAVRVEAAYPIGPDKMMTLSWPSVSGVRLQTTMTLAPPNWRDVPGSAATNTVTLPTTDAMAFFRLAQAPMQPSGMVAWWSGDGHADDLVGGNPGTLLNGATYVQGKVGQAFAFDGHDDYVAMANTPTLQIGSSDYSIAAWIKTATPNSGRVFSKGSACGSTGYHLRLDGDKVHFENSSKGSGVVFFDGNTTVTDDVWHFVVGVVDRHLGAAIYVDGILDATQAIDTSAYDLSNDVNPTIGANEDCCGQPFVCEFFPGAIDEVRVFSRALTAAEITALYEAGSAGTACPSP